VTKDEAITLLGGSPSAAAAAIGITPSAVSQWPELLPPRLVDRVQAALWRRNVGAAAPAAHTSAPHARVNPVEVRDAA